MTINDAKLLQIGDFVKIINTHKDKKTINDECIWMVIGVSEDVRHRTRYPRLNIELKLVKNNYYVYETNEIIKEGDIISRTHKSLKKIKVNIEEA